jgi:hypothetical protein
MDFGNQLVMIGDDVNRGFWHEHWSVSQTSSAKYDEFMRSFTKMSDYSLRYEMAFWRRPFAVEAWMRSEGVNRIFLLDSDVMTFANYSRDLVSLLPRDCEAALMRRHDAGCSSLHLSYWTIDSLTDFTSFCIEAYRDATIRNRLENKYRWMVENRMPGGICEMTLLHLWSKRHEGKVWNLAQVSNGVAGDMAINTSDGYFKDEYEMRGGFKRLALKHGGIYGYNKQSNQQVRFLAIHCQGRSKPVMRLIQMRMPPRFYPWACRFHETISSGRSKVYSLLALGAALRRRIGGS